MQECKLKYKEKKKADSNYNRGDRNQQSKNYMKKHPEKRKAHDAIYNAIKKGDIIRPDKYSKCNNECKPLAHHEDYTKVYDVKWLCQECHNKIHSNSIKNETLKIRNRLEVST